MEGFSGLAIGRKTIGPGDSAVNAAGLEMSLMQANMAGEAEGAVIELPAPPGLNVGRAHPLAYN